VPVSTNVFRLCALSLVGALAVQAAGPAAFVIVEKGSSHVGFFDANGALVKEVETGQHPHEMVFSSDGKYLFTSDNGVMDMHEKGRGWNTVSIIDVKAQRRVGQIDLGEHRRPHGIDFDRATGHVLVTTELPSALLILDPKERKVLHVYDVHGKAPHMVRLAADHRTAWVTCTDTSNVSIVDLPTGAVKTLATGRRPQGIVIAPDGRHIYVANSDGETITVIDTIRKELAGEVPVGGRHSGPVRVAIAPDGRTLLAALQLQHAAQFANATNMKAGKELPLPGPPVSMTLSADGRTAYCAVLQQDTIFVISVPEQRILRSFKTPPGSGPDPVLPIPR
jgi:YVTN family beta-propeller protein